MNKEKNEIIIVLLRQPRNRTCEMRSDPFWEFGSFGCTKCHQANLMNPKNAEELRGKRLAFAQGGYEGFKLIYLTPPIKIIKHDGFIEAKWTPLEMPFKYEYAPLLINNQGKTEIKSIINEIKRIRRTTWVAKFSSAFRSRKKPVSTQLAGELISLFEIKRKSNRDVIAKSYEEALPYNPPKIDRNRKATYFSFMKKQKKCCFVPMKLEISNSSD